jgi:phage anti-repressor protein
MLTLITHPSGLKIKSYELYHKLGYNSTHYDRWVKNLVLQYGEKELDYIYDKPEDLLNGRIRHHYLLHLEFAKTLCFCAKTKQALGVRKWLMLFAPYANFGGS